MGAWGGALLYNQNFTNRKIFTIFKTLLSLAKCLSMNLLDEEVMTFTSRHKTISPNALCFCNTRVVEIFVQ
jgi:hypothetical protein